MLVQMLRSQDNAGMRNSSVETLERLGRQAVPYLANYLADEDHDVRKFIIDILGHVGDPVIVPRLIKALEDPDPNVCAAAAENLGKIGDAEAVPHLLGALSSDNVWLCYTILEALSRIGKPVSFSIIAPLARDSFLRKAVYECLGVVGDAEAVPLLIEGMQEKAKSTRDAAVLALVKILERIPSEVSREISTKFLRSCAGSPFVDSLLTSFESAEVSQKEATVILLGMIGDPRAAITLMHGCRDDRLRRHCLAAFRNMGGGGTRALLDAFPSLDEEEQCLVLYICGELAVPECTEQLREGMRSPFPVLRKVAVTAVGKTAKYDLVNEVAALLDDPAAEVCEAAIEILSRFAVHSREEVLRIASQLSGADIPEKRRDAVLLFAALSDADKLSRLVRDEDALVRKAAVTSLAALHLAATVKYLIMALADEEVDVRIAAAEALGTLGGDEVYEPLLLALKDEDLWVRCTALKSLGKLGNEMALPAITEVFAAADGLEMVSVLEALSAIGTAPAYDLIKKALDSHDEDVVKAAISMLDMNGDGWLEQYREKLLAHPHWDVRCSFIKILAAKWGKRSVPYLQAALATETDELVKGQIAELLDWMH
jgi:HEAT repeat protein